MYWSRSLSTNKLGVPKLGSGGLGKARRIVAAGVSAYEAEDDILNSVLGEAKGRKFLISVKRT